MTNTLLDPLDYQPEPEDLILDASSEAQFRAGHIPGALWVPPAVLMAGTGPAPGKLAPLGQLNQVFNYLGLAAHRRVLVVDDEGGGWAGRLLWTLHMLGHRHCQYLDGGMRAWLAAGLPLSREITPPASNSQALQWHLEPSPRIELPRLLDEHPNWQIWDARSLAEYQGQLRAATYAGRIPGALHLDWSDLQDPARHYRIRTDALARLQEAGLDTQRPIVTHCQAHHRSAFTYLVGQALGLSICAYDGGWAEWGNHPDTPKHTG
jgi:thiosulfate/3-mercaptopyruvate sulfurtransferase